MNTEEILQAITATPDTKTAVISSLRNDFIEGLKGEGVILRTTDEEKEFLANYEKNILPTKVQEQIGEKIRQVHDQYDNDFFELTGEKKQPNEKTYDFIKRKVNELKSQRGATKDPVLEDRIKDYETKLKERENYVAPEEVDKIKQKYFRNELNFRLSTGLDKVAIAVPAHIVDERQKQEFVEKQKGMIKNDFLNRFQAKEDADGNVVYYDGDKVLTDSKTAKPLTEAELIALNYSVYLQPEKKALTGAGSGAGNRTADANEAGLKTKEDVTNYLNDKLNPKGIKQGSAEYTKEYMRIIQEYAITQ